MSLVPPGIAAFLKAPSPQSWVDEAVQQLAVLLNDHANCEKKAASSALALMFRYPHRGKLVRQMSRLAREELRHFEQVSRLMQRCEVTYRSVPASAYARSLLAACRTTEPDRLVDTLIVGALIEARSCERFGLLVPVLPEPVSKLYSRLLDSEARHFEIYLALADAMDSDIARHIDALATVEAELICAPDAVFAFHSGSPAG